MSKRDYHCILKALILIALLVIFYWLLAPSPKPERKLLLTQGGAKPHARISDTERKLFPSERQISVNMKMFPDVVSQDSQLKSYSEKLEAQKIAAARDIAIISKEKEELSAMLATKEKQLNKMIYEKGDLSDHDQSDAPAGKKHQKAFYGPKLMHLDFKGAPPRFDYLMQIVSFARHAGADGFLIEYEDMFPWSGRLANLRSKNAYSVENIRFLVTEIAKQNLTVIPLVQTFGHLEFALKHSEFKSIRETENMTNSLCPLNDKSIVFVKEMIDQILALHPDSEWLHVGGDEVWNLNSCERCRTSGLGRVDLYKHHMLPIFKHVKSKSMERNAVVQPLIWDDMMRMWPVEDLKTIGAVATPMVWSYPARLTFPTGMWDRYVQGFGKMWIASGFKGALKPWSNLVPVKQHITNQLSWLKIITDLKDNGVDILGITLTGWSRFDHFGPLCELLPAGLPSLALCLAALNAGHANKTLVTDVSSKLGFPSAMNITNFQHPVSKSMIDNMKRFALIRGSFPGAKAHQLVTKLQHALSLHDYAEHLVKGWMRVRAIERGHLSLHHIQSVLTFNRESLEELQSVRDQASEVLGAHFDELTVSEWVEEKINEPIQLIQETIDRVNKIYKTNTFS